MPGTLFVVATPIGNLEDLTFRALRTLREVDVIAAEDTRRTSKLLAHYGIRKTLVSLHEHNEHRAAPVLVARLLAGESMALVSDAGTPGISDPGATLVAAARTAGVTIVPIPGPSAVIAALSVCGFSGTEFVFLGFPPRSGQAREEWFEELANERRVAVAYEAPHRIERTLSEMSTSVKRQIFVAREMTKINEELTIRPNTDPLKTLGEFVVVIDGSVSSVVDPPNGADVFGIFCRLTETAGFSHYDAVRMISGLTDLSVPVVSKIVKKATIARKQAGRES